jgi:anti-repressor protein
MEELVYKTKKGTPVTSSLIVADIFEKDHKNVLQSIRELMTAENSAVLSMFYESTYTNAQNKKQPMFIMNRDGFSLLAMGFNGTKALQWKLKYIDAFNKLEEVVKTQVQLPDFTNPIIAARAWADEVEKKMIAEKKVETLEPKASYADRVLEHDNQMVDVGQTAKLLKLPIGRNKFFAKLREDGIFFKNRNEPKQEYIERKYFDVRKTDIPRDNHPGFTVLKVLVTPKGLFWLSKKYGGEYGNTAIPSLQLQ